MENAIYYAFNPTVASHGSEPPPTLGSEAALNKLHESGCMLASQEWVNNHWRLILWKLAGMACLDPQRELTTDKRWSWDEVIRQLRYRYALAFLPRIKQTFERDFRHEKELNRGSRPALRLIATQDVTPSSPMTLCVSNVFWSETTTGGTALLPHPELELTDGWYRLRASIDEPLARATRRGHIRIGRKLSVAGAKV